MNNFDLNSDYIEQVISILEKYTNIKQALIFGSRALKTNQVASDVDICLKGESIDISMIAEIKGKLERDTTIPYFFDVVSYETISSSKLIDHIDRVGKLFFQRKIC